MFFASTPANNNFCANPALLLICPNILMSLLSSGEEEEALGGSGRQRVIFFPELVEFELTRDDLSGDDLTDRGGWVTTAG